MKTKPSGSSFEALFPEFTKTDQYKIYAIDKELKAQADALNKLIDTADKTKLPDKLKKLMEYQVKNLNDPKVSQQLDTMIAEYTKNVQLGKRQNALLIKQQKSIKDARTQARKLGFDQQVAGGFSMAGLQSVTQGKGFKAGISTGVKYTGKSLVNSAKGMGISGITKSAMHFAGAALDSPILNILASNIADGNKKNDDLLNLMKEWNSDEKEASSKSGSSKSSGGSFGSSEGTIDALHEIREVSLENAVETEAVKKEAIKMGESLTSIDSNVGSMLFMFKDYLKDTTSTRIGDTGHVIGGHNAGVAAGTGSDSDKASDIFGNVISGTVGSWLTKAGVGSTVANIAKNPAVWKSLGSLAGILAIAKVNDTIGGVGISAFNKDEANDAKIAQFEGVKPSDVTTAMRLKHAAANAATSMSFGTLKPSSFLGDPSKFSAEDKAYMMQMTRNSESNGDYGSASVLKDNAGLTAGAYQFTEKSGSLGKMMESYAIKQRDAGNFSNFLPSDITEGLKKGSLTPEQRAKLTDYIKTQQQNNPEMFKQAQDQSYNEQYLDPAIAMASKYGITDKSAIAMFSDHYVNSGAGGAESMLKSMQASGVDLSNATVDDMATGRKNYYNKITASNPGRNSQYIKGWTDRVDENLTKLKSSDTMPGLPDVPAANGGIDEDMLARKIGAEVAKAMADTTPAVTTPLITAGNTLNKYPLEDQSDPASWKALTGTD